MSTLNPVKPGCCGAVADTAATSANWVVRNTKSLAAGAVELAKKIWSAVAAFFVGIVGSFMALSIELKVVTVLALVTGVAALAALCYKCCKSGQATGSQSSSSVSSSSSSSEEEAAKEVGKKKVTTT